MYIQKEPQKKPLVRYIRPITAYDVNGRGKERKVTRFQYRPINPKHDLLRFDSGNKYNDDTIRKIVSYIIPKYSRSVNNLTIMINRVQVAQLHRKRSITINRRKYKVAKPQEHYFI